MRHTLQIVVWDVQHGNAIYMKTPDNKHLMFDIGTGRYANRLEFSPLKYLRNRWRINQLHYLVISHPHADHISDIQNMLDIDLSPCVLRRPRNINEDSIKSSNQSKYSDIVDLYLELDRRYTSPVSEYQDPSNPSNYGGVQMRFFSQREKGTSNLNNYSIVSIIKYGSDQIIIPGDIEEAGWSELLGKEDFKQAIEGTTVFVASHHGRAAGFHSDIFQYFKPDIVIVSDGKYSDTSVTGRYGHHAQGASVRCQRTGISGERKVLTTRKDGPISIWIYPFFLGKDIIIP